MTDSEAVERVKERLEELRLQGQLMCDACKGFGNRPYVIDDPKTHIWKKCERCNGKGLIDWIKKARGDE